MTGYKTPVVAQMLGKTYHQVSGLVRFGRIRPLKDTSGDYVWSEQDVETARQILIGREKRSQIPVEQVTNGKCRSLNVKTAE